MPKKSTPVRSGAQRSKPKSQKSFELVRPATQGAEEPEIAAFEQPEENENKGQSIQDSVERSEQPANETKASRTTTATKERAEELERSVTASRRSRGRATQVSELAALPTVPQKKDVVEETTRATSGKKTEAKTPVSAATKGSASERLAARRQGTQKGQQRNAAALITAEHYSYVKRDLIVIAVLALIMIIILAVLYFTPGLGI